jgi:hypothetical protein
METDKHNQAKTDSQLIASMKEIHLNFGIWRRKDLDFPNNMVNETLS